MVTYRIEISTVGYTITIFKDGFKVDELTRLNKKNRPITRFRADAERKAAKMVSERS